MRLYTAVALRRDRSIVTMPQRMRRPAVLAPQRGPVATTCRCGRERAGHELLRPGRDCHRCLPHPAG